MDNAFEVNNKCFGNASQDPRDRLQKNFRKKKHTPRGGGPGPRIRPASNKLDRFGRIAFNKNKELSQASLDIKNDDGEEKKSKHIEAENPDALFENKNDGTPLKLRKIVTEVIPVIKRRPLRLGEEKDPM